MDIAFRSRRMTLSSSIRLRCLMAQDALTAENGDETLKDAVTKAGMDPAAVDACAATQATKDEVNASIKLAQEIGVEQTPMLAVNGHLFR